MALTYPVGVKWVHPVVSAEQLGETGSTTRESWCLWLSTLSMKFTKEAKESSTFGHGQWVLRANMNIYMSMCQEPPTGHHLRLYKSAKASKGDLLEGAYILQYI